MHVLLVQGLEVPSVKVTKPAIRIWAPSRELGHRAPINHACHTARGGSNFIHYPSKISTPEESVQKLQHCRR